jgi:HAD superfamily hydrolase (TIGR01549 family)
MDIETPLRAVFFDFDGVILESVTVKTNAFRALFSAYPEHLAAIINYHLENGGVSRFEKFNVIYRDILRQPLTPEEFQSLGQRFNELVINEVLVCPFVPGAYELLERLVAELPLFVISATPPDELRQIIQRRGLEPFFEGIYGAPPGKAETIGTILDEQGWKPGEVVFIGDSLNDLAAAQTVGVPFIGRMPADNSIVFEIRPVVHDLVELGAHWENVVTQARQYTVT